MSEENNIAPEDGMAERLREIENARQGNNKKTGPSKALFLGLMLGVGALVLGTVFVLTNKADDSRMEAGSSDGFQTSGGSAFGDMPLPQVIERETVQAPRDDSETQKLIAELRTQLEEMRRQMADTPDAPALDDSRLTALAEELERMKEADAARLAEQERRMREKDLEMQRLQSELDMARLGGNQGQISNARDRLRELQESRIASRMIAYGGSGGTGSADGANNDELEKRQLSDNEAFVRDGAKPAQVERSKVIVNPGNTVMQGTMIQASLETAIDSTLPGDIRAVVASDIHAFDGSRILIARGSRVIGKYSEEIRLGQKRVLVAWNRIIMPDNQSVTISAYGGNELGQSGVTGKVNSHFFQRFGSATLISLISAGPALAASQFENRNNNNSNNNNTVVDLTTSMGQNMQQSTQSVVGEYLRIKPTITIDQGARITIMVDRDLEIF